MKTTVIMKRNLFGQEIAQDSKTEMFSATDLVMAGNKWRAINDLKFFNLKGYFRKKSTIEFMDELSLKFTVIKKVTRGKTPHTWVHPLLFIDIALSISPKLKIEVYEWLFDHLIKNRNISGDSYKKMAGVLYSKVGNKKLFPGYMSKLAILIKNECKVIDWQRASEDQLALRDKMHENIALLANVMNNNQEAIRLGIYHSKNT